MFSVHSPDVIGITESWLHPNIDSSYLYVDSYEVFRSDRIDRVGGGVCVWCKKSLLPKQLEPKCNFNTTHIQLIRQTVAYLLLHIQKTNSFVFIIYVPPSINAGLTSMLNDFIVDLVDLCQNDSPEATIYILGDFNQFSTVGVESLLNVHNIVTNPTRKQATLDKILISSNAVKYYDHTLILDPIGSSDHNAVLSKPTVSPLSQSFSRILYDYRASNIEQFNDELSKVNWSVLYREPDIDNKCTIFYSELSKCVNKIPKITVKMSTRDKPWITPLLKYLINQRWQAYRDRDFPKYNHFKNKVKSEILKAKTQWVEKETTTKKSIWSVVNEVTGRKCKTDLTTVVSRFETEQEACNSINEEFVKYFTKDETRMVLENYQNTDDWCPLTEPHIIYQQLCKCDTKKSTGSDGIPNLLYKAGAIHLAEPICHLINESILTQKVPSSWKTANITPVPKTRPPQLANLRPISLLPLPSKLLEKRVLESVKKKLLSHVDPHQYGYKPQSSTTCALIHLHNIITKLLDSGFRAVAAVSLDFSKAFDTISHHLLLQKLSDLLFPVSFIKWTMAYLDARTQRIAINNTFSTALPITSGVPQGSILGPYFFILYISELKTENYTKYADDTSFVTGISHDLPKSNELLNNTFRTIQRQSSCLKLSLNSSKSKLLIICKATNENFDSISIPGVEKVTQLKLLGVHFTSTLKWDTHIAATIKKASKQFYALRIMRPICSKNQMNHIYHGLVKSLIEYACQVWVALPVHLLNKLRQFVTRCHRVMHGYECACNDIPEPSFRILQLATRLFKKAENNLDHPLHHLIPERHIHSRRLNIEHCKTSRRQSTFHIHMALLSNNLI